MPQLITEFVEAERMVMVSLDNNKQLECIFNDVDGDFGDKAQYRGSIQKIHNDKNGQSYGYDVYIY